MLLHNPDIADNLHHQQAIPTIQTQTMLLLVHIQVSGQLPAPISCKPSEIHQQMKGFVFQTLTLGCSEKETCLLTIYLLVVFCPYIPCFDPSYKCIFNCFPMPQGSLVRGSSTSVQLSLLLISLKSHTRITQVHVYIMQYIQHSSALSIQFIPGIPKPMILKIEVFCGGIVLGLGVQV